MSLVVDPSAILGLVLDGEAADFGDLVLEKIERDGACAPSIFWYEIRNVLVVNERRRRITPEKTAVFLAALQDLPIEIDAHPSELSVLQLARAQGLTVYDAAYLDLASRRGVALATLDNKLRTAAQNVSVQLFPGKHS
ncbi:MAG: type II toxin-antitoxin system VapC family toxin [Deltaproteobacteria bacterium]|nr:type II toxin-antitoxin system VapC family toxin [Deltaproteobacteria bacterium]